MSFKGLRSGKRGNCQIEISQAKHTPTKTRDDKPHKQRTRVDKLVIASAFKPPIKQPIQTRKQTNMFAVVCEKQSFGVRIDFIGAKVHMRPTCRWFPNSVRRLRVVVSNATAAQPLDTAK